MSTLTMQKKPDTLSYCIKLAIGLFLIFGFSHVCPAWGGITKAGMGAIGIFAGAIFLIATGYGLIMPSIFGLFGCMLTGFYTSATAISTTFGGPTVFQLIMIYAICQGLTETGAGVFIAKWFITRKFVQGKPLLFTISFFIASMFAGAVVSMGGIVFMYTVLDSVQESLGYPTESKWTKQMSLGTYISAVVGMAIIPFKGMPFLIFAPFAALMETYGISVNYIVYMISALVVAIAIVLALALLMRYFFKVDMDKIKGFDATKIEGMSNLKMTKAQIYSSLAFLIGILYSVVQIFLKDGTAVKAAMDSISQGVWFALMFGVMCILRVNGQKIIKEEKTMQDAVLWGVILCICTFTLVGNMISSNDLGVKAWLTTILNPVFGGMGFPFFMLVLIALSVIITAFLANAAIGIIVGAIAAPFVAEYSTNFGISAAVVGCAIVMAVSYDFLFMAGSGTAPLYLTRPAIKDDQKFVWTKGPFYIAVGIIIMSVLFTLLAYIL